jgi:hypothetical protein
LSADTTPTPETAEPTTDCERCGAGYTGDWCPSCGLSLAPVPCEGGAETRFLCVLCGRPVCGREPGDRPAVCEPHASIPLIEGWAQVYSSTSDLDAGLIVQNLEAEGVDAQVYSQKDDIFPVDLGELSIVRVLVPVWQFEQGLQVVLDRMDTSGEVVFACPACGEVNEVGAARCTACESRLVVE